MKILCEAEACELVEHELPERCSSSRVWWETPHGLSMPRSCNRCFPSIRVLVVKIPGDLWNSMVFFSKSPGGQFENQHWRGLNLRWFESKHWGPFGPPAESWLWLIGWISTMLYHGLLGSPWGKTQSQRMSIIDMLGAAMDTDQFESRWQTRETVSLTCSSCVRAILTACSPILATWQQGMGGDGRGDWVWVQGWARSAPRFEVSTPMEEEWPGIASSFSGQDQTAVLACAAAKHRCALGSTIVQCTWKSSTMLERGSTSEHAWAKAFSCGWLSSDASDKPQKECEAFERLTEAEDRVAAFHGGATIWGFNFSVRQCWWRASRRTRTWWFCKRIAVGPLVRIQRGIRKSWWVGEVSCSQRLAATDMESRRSLRSSSAPAGLKKLVTLSQFNRTPEEWTIPVLSSSLLLFSSFLLLFSFPLWRGSHIATHPREAARQQGMVEKIYSVNQRSGAWRAEELRAERPSAMARRPPKRWLAASHGRVTRLMLWPSLRGKEPSSEDRFDLCRLKKQNVRVSLTRGSVSTDHEERPMCTCGVVVIDLLSFQDECTIVFKMQAPGRCVSWILVEVSASCSRRKHSKAAKLRLGSL